MIGDARRILVYGVTGSGKTTLAKRLSHVTGLPWHSVDDLTWEPDWVPVSLEVQRERLEAICAGESWILDTAYANWIDIPLARVELIVALDYPRWVSLGRLVRRTLLRLVDGKKICNGNRETLRNFFSKDAILVWHFRSFARKRARIKKWESDLPGVKVLVFRRPQDLDRWVAGAIG